MWTTHFRRTRRGRESPIYADLRIDTAKLSLHRSILIRVDRQGLGCKILQIDLEGFALFRQEDRQDEPCPPQDEPRPRLSRSDGSDGEPIGPAARTYLQFMHALRQL